MVLIRRLSVVSKKIFISNGSSKMPSSDYAKFRNILKDSKNILVITGAGISAESGIPTFRGAGGFWRTSSAPDLATPSAFQSSPSLVWEFYHYRRELVLQKHPNKAHQALTEFQKNLGGDRKLTIVTQNIDELHKRAGSTNVIELHGSLYKTLCTKCDKVEVNRNSPICKALAGKGAPDEQAVDARIPVDKLPACTDCGGLLRPYVVWFGEGLDTEVLSAAQDLCETCDLCLVVGTSSVVYPAAMFAPSVSQRGVPVAEFNIEATPVSHQFTFYFEGPCSETLPKALLEH